ncbi:hypothetical protein LXL04_033762 [Taraxacum kok-saghyz]
MKAEAEKVQKCMIGTLSFSAASTVKGIIPSAIIQVMGHSNLPIRSTKGSKNLLRTESMSAYMYSGAPSGTPSGMVLNWNPGSPSRLFGPPDWILFVQNTPPSKNLIQKQPCALAVDLWELLGRWWQVDIPVLSSMTEWTSWIDGVQLRSGVRRCLEAVGLVLLWSIWMFRNNMLFNQVKPIKAVLWDQVQAQSFLWISSRTPKFNKYNHFKDND